MRPRDVICLRRCQHFPIGRCRYLPSPSSLLARHLSHRERQGSAGTETVLRPSDFRAARALRGSRKTVNGAYRYRYAPFLVPIYDALALLWESCHLVTERTLRPRDVICLRRCQHFPIGRCRYLPSPSSLRSATSPTGRGKGMPGRKPFYDHPTFGRRAH